MEDLIDGMMGHGIELFDLAIARGPVDARKFQLRNLAGLAAAKVLSLSRWLQWENHRGADIYFRPARHLAWPVIFLDDLTPDQAKSMASNFQCWTIETSPGRFHAWILADSWLTPREKFTEQKNFVGRGIGDPGSVSGDHLGRLPGFKNWKRGGVLVRMISSPGHDFPLLHPQGGSVFHPQPQPSRGRERKTGTGTDESESGKEFGWALGWLRKGLDPQEAVRRLTVRAAARGKKNPESYARRTVQAARERI